MSAGTKRTSDGDAPTTRASKAAKTDSDSPPKGGKGKKAAAKKVRFSLFMVGATTDPLWFRLRR